MVRELHTESASKRHVSKIPLQTPTIKSIKPKQKDKKWLQSGIQH